jgi:hypothetical protein
MTDTPTPTDADQRLTKPLELPPSQENLPAHEDALARVILRVMQTDPETNLLMSNVPRGEAEDYAADATYAEFSGSPVMLRFANMRNMAKRAEGGHFLDKILGTIKAIGKAVSEPKPGFFNRFGPR